jgi:Trk K+ transport system NAD-binding subunit
MKTRTVLIIGSGHLAYRVKGLIMAKGYEVTHITDLLSKVKETHLSTIDAIKETLAPIDLSSLSMIYILDEKDEPNLEMVIALMALHQALPITTSLFNEAISSHLHAANPQLHILNPARIAAPAFIKALYQPLNRQPGNAPAKLFTEGVKNSSDSFIKILIASFASLIFLATAWFHFNENLSWLDAFYFVVVTVSTVGYGDINLQHASTLSKVIGIVLIFSSTIFIWMIFSLTIDRIIKVRVQHSLGRKKYHYKNHIILCGLGRLGYFIAEELHSKGEKVLIVESAEASPYIDYFRSLGMEIYTGNARLPRVLQDVGITHARALISVINDDYANLEIGLNARSFQPGLRLILRIFDESMARTIKDKLDIHLTLSMSAIADEKFAAKLDENQ